MVPYHPANPCLCVAGIIDASCLVNCMQDFTAAQAALQQMNLQLAAAVAERNMAEPKSRLAAEEARVHAENAVVRLLSGAASKNHTRIWASAACATARDAHASLDGCQQCC
jgi:hypothetical protein